MSRQMKANKQNYPMDDLVLAAIIQALKIQRHNLFREKYNIFTNHKNFKYIFDNKHLNLRQRRWMKLIKDYDCTIVYHSEKANVVADALSQLRLQSCKQRKSSLIQRIKKLRGNFGRRICWELEKNVSKLSLHLKKKL